MRIAECYSHLNGYEYLQFHKPSLWREIEEVIASVDAQHFRTKVSKEKTMIGAKLYAPGPMNEAIRSGFADKRVGRAESLILRHKRCKADT